MRRSPLETQTADAANEAQVRLNRSRLVAVFRDYKLRQEVVLPPLASTGLHSFVQEGGKRRGDAVILQQQRQAATGQSLQQSCFSWPWLACSIGCLSRTRRKRNWAGSAAVEP